MSDSDSRYDEIVADLQRLDERLRDLALGSLSEAVRDGAADSSEERRIQRARRGIVKAINELGGRVEHYD